jgi:hypothetical protein
MLGFYCAPELCTSKAFIYRAFSFGAKFVNCAPAITTSFRATAPFRTPSGAITICSVFAGNDDIGIDAATIGWPPDPAHIEDLPALKPHPPASSYRADYHRRSARQNHPIPNTPGAHGHPGARYILQKENLYRSTLAAGSGNIYITVP